MKITDLLEVHKADIYSVETYLYDKMVKELGKNPGQVAFDKLKYARMYWTRDKIQKAEVVYAAAIKKLKHKIDLMLTVEEIKREIEFGPGFEERAYQNFLDVKGSKNYYYADERGTWVKYLDLPEGVDKHDRSYVEEEAYDILKFEADRKQKERLAAVGRKERQRKVAAASSRYSGRDIYDRAGTIDAMNSIVDLDKNRKVRET